MAIPIDLERLQQFLLFASPIVKHNIKDGAVIGSKSKPIDTYFGPHPLSNPSQAMGCHHHIFDYFKLEPD
jgi:hypothetical protein